MNTAGYMADLARDRPSKSLKQLADAAAFYERRREQELMALVMGAAGFDGTKLRRAVQGWDVGLPVEAALRITRPDVHHENLALLSMETLEAEARAMRGILLEVMIARILNEGRRLADVVLAPGQQIVVTGDASEAWHLMIDDEERPAARSLAYLKQILDTNTEVALATDAEVARVATDIAKAFGDVMRTGIEPQVPDLRPGGFPLVPPIVVAQHGDSAVLIGRRELDEAIVDACASLGIDVPDEATRSIVLDGGRFNEDTTLRIRLGIARIPAQERVEQALRTRMAVVEGLANA